MNQYDHIRKNLKDFNVPIDKDKLWANTAHAIPKKRRKRGAFFLLLGGTLLISGAVTFYALTTSENNITAKTEIQSTSNAATGTPANEVINTTIHEMDRATTESKMTATSAPESNQIIVSNAKNNTEQSNAQASAATATTPSGRRNATRSIMSSQHSGVPDASSNIETSKDPSFPNETRGSASSNDSEFVITEPESNLMSGADKPDPVIVEPTLEVRKVNYLTKDIPILPIIDLNILPREISTSDVVASRTKNSKRINLLLLQSFGWSTMKIVTDNPELQPTVDVWKNQMSSLENLSTSLQASIRLPKGMQLGGGLQYSKLTTQMDYQQTTTEDYTVPGITEIIIDEQGNVQNLMGDVHVRRQTIINSTRFTSHQRLDVESTLSIPVIRNYRTETGVWVKVGYNILYHAEGTTFDQGEVTVRFSSTDNPYALQSPFTFGAGIGTLYRITPRWTLNARAGYERLRYTHGLFDEQISFHHSIFSLGLGAGYTF